MREEGTNSLPLDSSVLSLLTRLGRIDEARAFLAENDVSDTLFARATERFGRKTVVELAGILGYYSLISMTLNVFRANIPDDQPLAFKFFSQQAEDPNGDGNSADGIGGWENNPAEGDNQLDRPGHRGMNARH